MDGYILQLSDRLAAAPSILISTPVLIIGPFSKTTALPTSLPLPLRAGVDNKTASCRWWRLAIPCKFLNPACTFLSPFHWSFWICTMLPARIWLMQGQVWRESKQEGARIKHWFTSLFCVRWLYHQVCFKYWVRLICNRCMVFTQNNAKEAIL